MTLKKNVTVIVDDAHATVPALIDVFICPSCDKTHMQITVPGASSLYFSFAVTEAEALGKELINPGLPPRPLGKLGA